MNNSIVTFRALASDNSVVALCNNFDAISVPVETVMNYITKMKDLTGGSEVEFNDTFRQVCNNRVFYTFEPIENKLVDAFNEEEFVPAVVECVLLSDNRVAMNINNIIMVCYGEEGNMLWKTKEDATEAAYDNAFMHNSNRLDELTAERRRLKAQLHELSDEISKRVAFRNTLTEYDINNNCY